MIRTILIAVFANVLALPLAAQDATHFFIERIEVRNASRVSPEVVIAESRLREGREYSEPELREASHRINRLPFILTADFSLEKGSERGRHVLVLSITETKPFFFRIDARFYVEQDESVFTDYRDSLTPASEDLALGFRWFVGRRGAFHVGLQGDQEDSFRHTRNSGSLAVGYTQYDLFGTRAFVTLNLKKPVDIEGGVIAPQLVAGIPLSLNQTLTLSFDRTEHERDEVRLANGETFRRRDEQDLLRLRWSYNTMNDPFVPTEGSLFSVSPLAVRRSGMSTVTTVFPDNRFEFRVVPYEQDAFGVEAHALRYWAVSDFYSVAAAAEAGWSSIDRVVDGRDDDADESFIALQTGVSRSLWSPERRAGGGDSRVEANVRWSNDSARPELFERKSDHNALQLTTSWVRRSSWGTLRLGVGYVW